MFIPRQEQERIINYTGGRMGISAVPGSGKTHTLAYLAARLVREHIQGDQEVLVVTFTNSGVENFYRRIRQFLETESGLLPDVGYRVRTLHGLANDIIHERPALLGLPDDFVIADERESRQILDEIVLHWVRSNPQALDEFVAEDVTLERRKSLERERWPDMVRGVAESFIRRAKDLQVTPAELRQRLPDWRGDWRLARLGLEIYEDYDRALGYRGAIDFDDLVRLALEALQIDPDLTARLRERWPYILEDEAQDSSRLQEKILRLLTATPDPDVSLARQLESELPGNWVRVGDPNQAINTTFTTSQTYFLRRFLGEPGVADLPLLHSGRSTQRIIDLANHLVDWVIAEHPNPQVRENAFRLQHIQPTPPGDPQPSPVVSPDQVIVFYNKPLSPEKELDLVAASLQRWLPEHGSHTVAILVPDNSRGFKISELLKSRSIPHDDHLNTTAPTRRAAEAIGSILAYLAQPLSGAALAKLYPHWMGREAQDLEETDVRRAIYAALQRCDQVEAFLWPRPDRDWLSTQTALVEDDAAYRSLERFRDTVRRWLGASNLPVDQLVLTVAQDLYHEAGDLALAFKIALLLRQLAETNPTWGLQELAKELTAIARNQQRFAGFEDDESFTPRPGCVTITTMHKAKGLEWDRVYLLGVNNYDFPSVQDHDVYRGERMWIRASLNLEAEALAQLEALRDPDPRRLAHYVAGQATYQARIAYTEERLRLLYVGITRARQELIVTWNVGGFESAPKQAAAPFLAMYTYLQEGSSSLDQTT